MATTSENGDLTMDPELARQICRCLAEDAIRCGLVDPKGKTDEQLRLELLECLRDVYLDRMGGFVHDHTSALLKRAREFRSRRDYCLSCLLYATWAEHSVNGLISTMCERRRLQPDEKAQIIRETPLRGKLTWLFSLLGLPRIADRHRNAILHLMDLRNGFVHYKWQGKDDTVADQEQADIERSTNSFEHTVKYLRAYEARRVFAQSRRRVRKVI